MKKAIITKKCFGDPICMARLRCPNNAIHKSKRRTKVPIWFFTYSEIIHDKCAGCGKCVTTCFHKAVEIIEIN